MMYMQIVQLTKEEFDQFASTHQNHNFYQTSQYGVLMSRHGFEDIYIGLLNADNILVGASLILTQKKLGRFKSGYAPRGFLIDFNDFNLVTIFTKLIRQYLQRLGYIYIKIDPYVVNIERDKRGKPVPNGINNSELIKLLKKLNYEHCGFNLYFENLKPRWNTITKLETSSDRLLKLLDKQTRNKIRRAYKRGITVYKGDKDDLKLFYSLIDKKHSRKINYYYDYYEIFSKNDMFDIYFAKLDPSIYIKTSKDFYEAELQINNDLTDLVQENVANNNDYINLKMHSDKLLNIYKNQVINANNLFRAYPNGIVVATSAVVKYNREVFFLIDGYLPKFKSFCPNHLLKWTIINEHARKGFLYVHHNGITGNFDKTNPYYGLYEFKKGFNSNIVEYIGEFDLVINKHLYYTLKQWRLVKKLLEFKK